MKRGRGRPPGPAIDATAEVRAVLAKMADNPGISKTTAIRHVLLERGKRDECHVRRLQRRLQHISEARP